jgi:hypothetical protein
MEWPRDDRGYAAAYRARRLQPGGWYPPGWGGGAVYGLDGGGPYPYHPFAGYGGDFEYDRDYRAERHARRRAGYGREFAPGGAYGREYGPRVAYGREYGPPGEEAVRRGGRDRGYAADYGTGRLRRDAGPSRGDWRRRGY